VIFITATNTNIGKTKACEILIKKYFKLGLNVAYFKPIETGIKHDSSDTNKILNLLNQLNKNNTPTIDMMSHYRFSLPAAPVVANSLNIDIDINCLLQKTANLLKLYDVVLVEGAGGLKTPITQKLFMIDLIKYFQDYFEDFEALLVAPSYLGCINDTLLSLDCLKNYNIKHNWVVNLHQNKKQFEKITKPFYDDYFKYINYLQDI